MNEEEIKKQYANGIVDIDKLVGSLIDKFKIDKTSVDIQQLQLIAEYLLYKVDKLQKDNYKLDRENQHFFDRIQDLQKENGKLKEQRDNAIKLRNELIEEQKITCISKNKIRNKIKEVAEEPQIYVDTEKFDIEFEKSNYTIDVLKELLGE